MVERTSEGQRVEFYRRYLRGETYSEIAQACNVSRECVRYWCRKQKKGQGVKSQWHIPKRGALSRFDAEVVNQIKQLREENRCWGPNSLRMHLEDEPALKGKFLPSPASIGRWLHEDPANRRHPKSIQPSPPFLSLQFVHQRWQIDFKVGIHLTSGETVQLHTVTDPLSGAFIGALLYVSKPNSNRVPLADVQATLRVCFIEWGLPDEVQTDGEPILAATDGELPTGFTLWLAGLGIVHRVIPAGKPTTNGSVERSHRTIYDHSIEAHLHLTKDQLQKRLNRHRKDLNARYPSRAKGCEGQPPLLAHPELLHPRRAYARQHELISFDLGKSDAFLAKCQLQRKVGKKGQITIGGEHEYYSVGSAYAGQFVQIRFEPQQREFVAYLSEEKDQQREVARWPARNLEVYHLLWPGDPPPMHCPQQLLLDLVGDIPVENPEKVDC